MHIWVDLDEVLAETVEEVLKFHNYILWWKKILLNDISDYYIWNIPWIEMSREQAISIFKDYFEKWDLCKIKPVSWAKDQLDFLKSKWFETTVITARRIELKEHTIKWLDEHYRGVFQDVYFAEHFTDNHKEKSEICQENDIQYMIEDNFDYALDTANAGIKTFLIEKPWNRHIIHKHKNIVRVKNWKDISII